MILNLAAVCYQMMQQWMHNTPTVLVSSIAVELILQTVRFPFLKF